MCVSVWVLSRTKNLLNFIFSTFCLFKSWGLCYRLLAPYYLKGRSHLKKNGIMLELFPNGQFLLQGCSGVGVRMQQQQPGKTAACAVPSLKDTDSYSGALQLIFVRSSALSGLKTGSRPRSYESSFKNRYSQSFLLEKYVWAILTNHTSKNTLNTGVCLYDNGKIDLYIDIWLLTSDV